MSHAFESVIFQLVAIRVLFSFGSVRNRIEAVPLGEDDEGLDRRGEQVGELRNFPHEIAREAGQRGRAPGRAHVVLETDQDAALADLVAVKLLPGEELRRRAVGSRFSPRRVV